MAMSHRLRLSLIGIGCAVVVAVLIALLVAFLLLRPERFTRTLRNAANDAGMRLTLSAPAHPTLWPEPGLRLEGLQLFVKGQSDPMLIAAHGNMVVPWRTLFGGPTAISRLQLQSPRLDLAQLQIALSRLPASANGAPSLPNIDAGIRIRNGTLVSGSNVLLKSIALQTGKLVPEREFNLTLNAKLASGQPVTLSTGFTPHSSDKGVIDLKNLRINAHAGKQYTLGLDGNAKWHGGARLNMALSGKLVMASHGSYQVQVRATPPAEKQPLRLHLQLDGKTTHANVHVAPARLASWWQRVAGDHAPGPLPEPPVDGRIDASKLSFGGMHVRGLKIRSGDAVPASSSSAPATATHAAK